MNPHEPHMSPDFLYFPPFFQTTTPRKSNPNEKVSISRTPVENQTVPKALGLVANNKSPKVPKTPETAKNVTKKPKLAKNSVQRNLLDEDGFLSPVKLKVKSPRSKANILQGIRKIGQSPKSEYKLHSVEFTKISSHIFFTKKNKNIT